MTHLVCRDLLLVRFAITELVASWTTIAVNLVFPVLFDEWSMNVLSDPGIILYVLKLAKYVKLPLRSSELFLLLTTLSLL